jgi:hypothetical protein
MGANAMDMSKMERGFVTEISAGGQRRQNAFDFLKKEFAETLGNGEAGFRVYEDLLEVVNRASSDEATTQFQKQFVPLLDQNIMRKKVMDAFEGTLEKEADKAEKEVKQRRMIAETITALEKKRDKPGLIRTLWRKLW